MSARTDLRARVDDYFTERRRLGFELHSMGLALASFARYVARVHHRDPLTVDLMADWARHDKGLRTTRATWARRLKMVRPFARWLRQFEPSTEVPDESIFGSVPDGRRTDRAADQVRQVAPAAAAPKHGGRPDAVPAAARPARAHHRRDAVLRRRAGQISLDCPHPR